MLGSDTVSPAMSAKKKSSKGRRPPPRPSRPAAARTAASGPAATRPPAAEAGKPRRERTGPTKAERLAAAEAARRRRALRNRALVAGALAAVLVAITLVVVNNRREADERARQLEAGGCQLDADADADAGLGRNHVPSPTYRVNPPAGGDHSAEATAAGVYTVADLPPDGAVVHAMEHGYVVLWHVPELPAEQVEQLRALARRYPRDVLLVPRPGMPTQVAATAWHRRLLCGAAPDLAALEKFVVDFRNQGPEKVPH